MGPLQEIEVHDEVTLEENIEMESAFVKTDEAESQNQQQKHVEPVLEQACGGINEHEEIRVVAEHVNNTDNATCKLDEAARSALIAKEQKDRSMQKRIQQLMEKIGNPHVSDAEKLQVAKELKTITAILKAL